MKLTESSRYYLYSAIIGFPCWFILTLLDFYFVNIIFFILAFVWHFSLLAPGVKEMALTRRNRFSLLSVVFRANFYLQMFLRFEKFPYTPSVVRGISPLTFTFFLLLVGGGGNLLFTILGSLTFEILYLKLIKKSGIFLDS